MRYWRLRLNHMIFCIYEKLAIKHWERNLFHAKQFQISCILIFCQRNLKVYTDLKRCLYQVGYCLRKAWFPLGDKWRYLTIIFRRYLTIIFKTFFIRFTDIKSEFWSSFDIMSDSEGIDILFLQLVVLFKMKKKKRRKRKKWVRELFRKREEKRAFNNLIQKWN